MREILFRGKRVDTKEWVFGWLIYKNKVPHIVIDACYSRGLLVVDSYEVIPETVGQYTGVQDKNGTKIFEGDIVRLCEGAYPCIAYWDGIGWAWRQNGKRRAIDLTRERMTIIGNVHDNPELLEVD